MVVLLVLFLSLISSVNSQACEADHDVFHWRRLGGFFEFRDFMRTCSLQLLGDTDKETFESDFAACLKREGLPYRFDCRVCFANLARCTISDCVNGCFFGDDNAACEECADTLCNPDFLTCGGDKINPKECPECVKPLGEIIFFLPDPVTILLIILISGGLFYTFWKLTKSKHSDDDSSVDSYADFKKPEPIEMATVLTRKKPSTASNLSPSLSSSNPQRTTSKKSKETLKTPSERSARVKKPSTVLTRQLDFDQITEAPQVFRSHGRRLVPDANQSVAPTEVDFEDIESPEGIFINQGGPPEGFRLLSDDEEKEELRKADEEFNF